MKPRDNASSVETNQDRGEKLSARNQINPNAQTTHTPRKNYNSEHSRGQDDLTKRVVKFGDWRDNLDRMQLYGIQKRLTFDKIRKMNKSSLTLYHSQDNKAMHKTLYTKLIVNQNDRILNVVLQTDQELLANYNDRFPFLGQRKAVLKVILTIQLAAQGIVTHKLFENGCILVILFNSFTLALDDPVATSSTPAQDMIEQVLQGIYTAEMVLKIVAWGFLFGKRPYIRDPWNMLDFTVVMSAYLTIVTDAIAVQNNGGKEIIVTRKTVNQGGLSLSSLRAFRVLRPLKAVTAIKGLQVIVKAVLTSLPLLQDTILVILTFFLIFSIIGNMTMSGLLKNRCYLIETGEIYDPDWLCGARGVCPSDEYFCGMGNANPNSGVTSFDNLPYGMLIVWQLLTGDGWSDVMSFYLAAYNQYSFIFTVPMYYILNAFLLNLLLGVINAAFSETTQLQREKDEAIRAKQMIIKKKPSSSGEDAFDEDEVPTQIGLNEYWVAKRVAVKWISILRKAQDREKLLKKSQGFFGPDDEEEEIQPAPKLQAPVQVAAKIDTDDSSTSYEMDSDIQVVVTELPAKPTLEQSVQMKVSERFKMLAGEMKGPKKLIGNQVEMLDVSKNDGLLNISNILVEVDRDQTSFVHSYVIDRQNDSKENPKQQDDVKRNKKKNEDIHIRDQIMETIISQNSFNKSNEQQPSNRETTERGSRQTMLSPRSGKETIKSARSAKSGNLLVSDGSTTARETQKSLQLWFKKKPKEKVKENTEVEDNWEEFRKLNSDPDLQFTEFIKSADPRDEINKKIQKIEILHGMPYRGTSADDIFQIRNELSDKMLLQDINKFVKANIEMTDEEEEVEEVLQGYPKPTGDAYQLKTQYKFVEKEEVDLDSSDDDQLILALQPFDSSYSVGYGHLLTQVPVKFLARKSDLIVTSTLSLTLSPAEIGFRPRDKAKIPVKELDEYCTKRQQYRAMAESTAKFFDPNLTCNKTLTTLSYKPPNSSKLKNQSKDGSSVVSQKNKLKDRDSSINSSKVLEQSDNSGAINKKNSKEVKSFDRTISTVLEKQQQKAEQEKITHKKNQKSLIPASGLTQPLPGDKLRLLNDEEKRLYQIQRGMYENYKKLLIKKEAIGENPKNRRFKLSEVQDLLVGHHHEDQESSEDSDDSSQQDYEVQMNYMTREESFKKAKFSNFEEPLKPIHKRKHRHGRKKHQYIPKEIMEEFNLPKDMMQDTVNFDEVISKDCNLKRKTPYWSGQDVLEVGLNMNLASEVLANINKVRVWPPGFIGTLKKARVLLKMFVKHEQFGNLMTFFVLLNTVGMSMQKYNMDLMTVYIIEFAGEIFTWIFICEMVSRIIAIGPVKYLRDKMNWLDGGIVSLSIFEMLLTAVIGSGGGSAFKAIRVLRTLRVLRVARLLRQLKSMQVIIKVISVSFMDFVYITLLVFVFIFIYTLLGMRLFGGHLNFPEGLPRQNFDTFIVAFFTSFQIMTGQSWMGVLYNLMMTKGMQPGYIPVVYGASWIFVGNFILLNLFLAIVLDSFMGDDEDEPDAEELIAIKAHLRKLQHEEKIRRLKKMGVGLDYLTYKDDDQIDGQIEKDKKEDEIEVLHEDVEDLTIFEIKELFMDLGIIKKIPQERINRLMYTGVECERAQYFFSKQNCFRRFLHRVMDANWFNNFLLFLIGLSSLKLAINGYIDDMPRDSIVVTVSFYLDMVVNLLFLGECIIKNIVLGSWMDEGSYLRDNWNRLDGFIVATSILDMALADINIPGLKVIKLLRTLRPLRVISKNKGMRLIVFSLFDSIGPLGNVVMVVICAWGMFAIFAINIYAGKMFYCDVGTYQYGTKYECNKQGGSWSRYDQNFDDIIISMQTLFILGTNDWTTVLYQLYDVVDVDKGPIRDIGNFNGFFPLSFVFVGQLFFMNFFVGVLFLNFTKSSENEKKGYSKENLTWLDICGMIIKQTCPHELMNKPDRKRHPNRFKYWVIVNSNPFEYFIISVIVLNIASMAAQFQESSAFYNYLLDLSNYVFSFIFIVEMYLKMRAYNYRYFDTFQHKFDFFIVVSSIVDIAMGFAITGPSAKSSGQITKMIRVLRVTRIARLAGKSPGLRALMSTIILSIGPLANVAVLLVMGLFIFAIVGNFFFSGVTTGPNVDEYRNFTDFGNSFLFMFVLGTGDYLDGVMFDYQYTPPGCVEGETCGSSYSPIFFIMTTLFLQFVLLNLFVLVIIQQFELYYMSADNPITKFKKNLEAFMTVWVEMTATKYRCIRLREKKLVDFFKRLPHPIGLPLETTDEQMKKIMLRMGIKCPDGYAYFNELLYRCMRRQFGNFKLNKRMMLNELKTQYTIFCIKLDTMEMSFTNKVPRYDQFLDNVLGSDKSSNPFLQEMYFNITFLTWLNYANKMKRREKFEFKQEMKRQRMWSQGLEFIPDVLTEPPPAIKHIEINVEEIFEVTSEEESEKFSDDEAEALEPPPKYVKLGKKQLLNKSAIKPEGGLDASKLKNTANLTFISKVNALSIVDLLIPKPYSKIEFKIIGEDTIVIKSPKQMFSPRSTLMSPRPIQKNGSELLTIQPNPTGEELRKSKVRINGRKAVSQKSATINLMVNQGDVGPDSFEDSDITFERQEQEEQSSARQDDESPRMNAGEISDRSDRTDRLQDTSALIFTIKPSGAE